MQFSWQKAHQALLRLAQADMVFYLLPPLMILLTAGTLAQAEMGLYAAHRMFFASFVFWAGPVPLPGGYLLISLISFNLLLKFFLQSVWSRAKAGINLSHLGVLILLAGGLLTALTQREAYMIIPEGGETPYIYDYHARELMIFEKSGRQTTIPFADLKQQAPVTGLPFTVNILGRCENCQILKREDTEQGLEAPLRGMAQFMALENAAGEKEPEQNLSGITFEISGLNEEQNGVYIAFEGMPEPIALKKDRREFKIVLGKQQRSLPFALKLIDFKKDSYPGMDMARAYSSEITVIDGKLEWPVLIEMNKPLRYKGYTFYQSSFEQTPDTETTILSVVENKGRLFPYAGTAIILAGLLLHIFITIRKRKTA